MNDKTPRWTWKLRAPASLRARLLWGILVPMVVVLTINAGVLYRQALRAADTAYDRTLLATAKSIGEQLSVQRTAGPNGGQQLQVQSSLSYSALEPFEADNRSRMYYRVLGFQGETVSGFDDLPAWRGRIPQRTVYAALVDFYDDRYQDMPVRVAVLLQPVAGPDGQGMATIQVAETLELRESLARQMLIDTLWRQTALIALIAVVVVAVVQHATRPVRQLSDTLAHRPETELSPLLAPDAPQELKPLLEATNQHMARLSQLLEHQKRFVRDSSHQLRTPLAVLKTQVQSALRGDQPPLDALRDIGHTVDGAAELANQMLALAKVEQLRNETDLPVTDWAEAVRAVAIDVSALIADKQLDFDLDAPPTWVRAHAWALKELTRNLLHNAIRHTPAGGDLHIRITPLPPQAGEAPWAELRVRDSGPGLSASAQERLFQPFASASAGAHSAGLGLAICHSIVQTLGGHIHLQPRPPTEPGRPGLDAIVRLPLAQV
jgi:two-component system, OmpR family, sensor histidine kinase TctE